MGRVAGALSHSHEAPVVLLHLRRVHNPFPSASDAERQSDPEYMLAQSTC